MKKIGEIAGEVGAKLRDRSRSVRRRVLDIALAARAKGPQSQDKLKRAYAKLLDATSRVVGQANRFSKEIAKASSDRLTSWRNSRWKACATSSILWCRECGR
jgi:transposase, IS5 family